MRSSCFLKNTTPRRETTKHQLTSPLLLFGGCTRSSEVSEQFIRVWSFKPFFQTCLWEFTANSWSDIKRLVIVQHTRELQRSSLLLHRGDAIGVDWDSFCCCCAHLSSRKEDGGIVQSKNTILYMLFGRETHICSLRW